MFDEDESGKSTRNSAVEKKVAFEKILQSSREGVDGTAPFIERLEPLFRDHDRYDFC